VQNGKPIEVAAATFSVTLLVVKRRLKLAAGARRFLDLCRAGEATLGQLMALASTDNQTRQEALWDRLPN
jgi:ParB family transcriptional regulator, chromosome partitioning protein